MKTKIKRHSRSVLSVVLALCMLLSCMTAGMIMTDAAKADSESVSWNSSTDRFSYSVDNGNNWSDAYFSSGGVTTFTVPNDNSTVQFKLNFNGTVYNHNSSQSTFSADGMRSKDGETRLAKTDGSDYRVSGVYADTYTVKLTTTVNNGEVNFKINGTYVKQASSWTVVGDSEELFGGTWNTTNTANDLDMTQTPFTWTKNAVYLSAGDIEYKVVKDYAWAGCYPAAGNRKTTVSSSGYYNVTVTYDGNTDLKMTLDHAAKRTLTVPQIADATVTATYGSQTAAEGQSLTEVPAGADVTVNVTPDSGHKCTGVSAGSSTATGSGTNWTLKMPNSDATLSATIAAYTAQMRTIYFYNKYTQYPMVTIYAYYKDGSGNITDEIFGTGKTMTKLPNSDIWTIDVPVDAYVKFMGEGKNTGELQPVDNHPAAPKYVPGPDRDNPGTGGYWGEYIERNNVYSVNEGENMSSSNLFTGITATFYGCNSLETVSLPDGLETIERAAFAGCTSLSYVNIPANVTEISEYSFSDCPDLTLGVWFGSYGYQYAKAQNIPYILLDSVLLGDANGDGYVNISDVTDIQRAVAEMDTLDDLRQKAADINGDGFVMIDDATFLQTYLAEFETAYPIGEVV